MEFPISGTLPRTSSARMVSRPTVYQRVIAHRRVVAFLLVFGYSAFLLIHPDEFGRFADLLFFAFLVMLIASHLFWIRRVLGLGSDSSPVSLGAPGASSKRATN